MLIYLEFSIIKIIIKKLYKNYNNKKYNYLDNYNIITFYFVINYFIVNNNKKRS